MFFKLRRARQACRIRRQRRLCAVRGQRAASKYREQKNEREPEVNARIGNRKKQDGEMIPVFLKQTTPVSGLNSCYARSSLRACFALPPHPVLLPLQNMDFDLIIVGAGPVGLAVARGLAQRSATRALSVALID